VQSVHYLPFGLGHATVHYPHRQHNDHPPYDKPGFHHSPLPLFVSPSPRLPLVHLLHAGCEQYLYYLPSHTARVFLQFSIRTRGERMWHINHRIVWHPPYGRGSPTSGHKMIGANGGSRNTSTVQMDTVVHTARTTRASISHPDNGQVTELCPLLDHFRRHGL
jgi:hypothetical protein